MHVIVQFTSQERSMGKNVSKFVFSLAKTFSPVKANEILDELTHAARQYLGCIPASQWRNTAWLDDPTLPARFGITTSNMSESANSMFESARGDTWMHSVKSIISKMTWRIGEIRVRHKHKAGVVEEVAAVLKDRWAKCAWFKVIELQENGIIFSVIRRAKLSSDEDVSFNIDEFNRSCDCGEWQDHGVPCIDAIAYFRLHKKVLLEQVLSEHVNHNYTYEIERMLLSNNLTPVCMERVCYDGSKLPPKDSTKRKTGRPKKQRIRKRSRWAYEPDKSNFVCSRYHERGHNIRTCIVREALTAKGTDMNNSQVNWR
jgi:hypothetical protein